MIGLTVRQMAQDNYMGDMQKFGDVVTTPIDNAIRYYRLNARQKKSVLWLVSEHKVQFCENYNVVPDGFVSNSTLTRSGFNKLTQHLLVTLVMLKANKERLAMEIYEVRLIVIGRKGGMRLVNPARRGTVPHGKYVLIAVPDVSVLGIRTFEQ